MIAQPFRTTLSCIRQYSTTRVQHAAIPFVIDNDGRAERVYDVYSRLLKDRIICVMSPVHFFVEDFGFVEDFDKSSDSGKSPINMYINCPGGSVTAGLGIYDTMQYVSAPIKTWCIGQASSMGSLLLAAGGKGMRYSLPNSRIMVHQPSMRSLSGTASDILIQADEIKWLRTRLNEIYSSHTGQPVDVVCQTLDRDRFMSAGEAKSFGIIDCVVEHTGSQPCYEDFK